jgi:murein DD-endopeptidase MepM/ murein hydrolase activator NlpD
VADNGHVRRLRLGLPLAALAALLVVVSAGASSSRDRVSASANAHAAVVALVPPDGATPTYISAVEAPPGQKAPRSPYSYPADGSVVSVAMTSSTAGAEWAARSTADAAATLTGVSLFAGEITAETVVTRVTAAAVPAGASGDFAGTKVLALKVLGADVAAAPGTQVPLADWGTLTVLEETVSPSNTKGMPGFHIAVTGLHVHLLLDHGGLTAGTDLLIGSADAQVQAGTPANEPPPTPTTTETTTTDTTTATTTTTPDKRSKRGPGLSLAPPRREPNKIAHPPLTAGGYVFPIYGPSSFTDTFGAARADVSWHHGDDIFAPLGAPILAVADGTLFSVGWNDIGGLRVWLRDNAGNEFYFAHLSALATRTANGEPVQAGDVIGFVGNTGDARGTPYHLHFEIHPVSMLYLGYDGAVDPTKYLQAWARLQDVPITGVVGWAPPLGGHAPKAGAILLQSSDISTASGLDPASLRRAVRPATGLESLGAGGSRDTRVRVPSRPLDRG